MPIRLVMAEEYGGWRTGTRGRRGHGNRPHSSEKLRKSPKHYRFFGLSNLSRSGSSEEVAFSDARVPRLLTDTSWRVSQSCPRRMP